MPLRLGRDTGEVGDEDAEVPNAAELERKAEAVAGRGVGCDERSSVGAEVEGGDKVGPLVLPAARALALSRRLTSTGSGLARMGRFLAAVLTEGD